MQPGNGKYVALLVITERTKSEREDTQKNLTPHTTHLTPHITHLRQPFFLPSPPFLIYSSHF
jgi:hypothetical protein